MDNQKFKAMLILLVPLVIEEILANEDVSAQEAVERFYESRLYEVMENERTKLWHLSPKALYQMYCEERETGDITFPEEA